MKPTTNWWLHNTAQGRRTLERMVPRSAIPSETRRRMCAERGHDYGGTTRCSRCGDTRPDFAEGEVAVWFRGRPRLVRVEKMHRSDIVLVTLLERDGGELVEKGTQRVRRDELTKQDDRGRGRFSP